jgi:hypothetical protein
MSGLGVHERLQLGLRSATAYEPEVAGQKAAEASVERHFGPGLRVAIVTMLDDQAVLEAEPRIDHVPDLERRVAEGVVTALVNELYLRLVDVRQVHWNNRAHFYALSARLMRRILVDLARSKGYVKRGGVPERSSS